MVGPVSNFEEVEIIPYGSEFIMRKIAVEHIGNSVVCLLCPLKGNMPTSV